MALVVKDRVQELTTTSGTGTLTLSGAVPGYQTFSSSIGNGNTTFYTIYDNTAQAWEVGIGTVGAGTLARNTVLSNSLGTTALISFAGNSSFVFCTYPAEQSVNLDASNNVSPLGTIASGTWNGSTIGVAYGGTGVTASSGANSVMLRDANQNVAINRLNQANTSTAAAAGTTTLTAASSYSQTLTGTGTQTYKMPDATTLTTGVAFVFNNNATGTLTLQDYATGSIGTITAGGAVELVLLANSTVAGTWDVHGYLPENVTWGTNALNLGSTVITNGTWNGGTITSAYGGTGLTTFSAANNALYSTSSSALAAGTLPIAAGGTAATTFTANGVVYGNGTSALGVTAAGTTGQVLLANTSGAPTWGSVPSTGAVTSFQTSLSGLTPSTATTGAVTLAGTLGPTSGGTGTSTAFTTGSVIFAGTSGVYSQSNANFFWDNTNARLGIGTNTVAAKLGISQSSSTAYALITQTPQPAVTTGSYVNMAYFADSRGTNNDGLRIVNYRDSTGATINDWPTASYRIRRSVDQNDGATGVQEEIVFGNYLLAFNTSGSERMRIDSSGNVGIGTTSPAAKLDIGSGNLNFSSTAQRITGDFSNATHANRVLFQSSTTNGSTIVGFIPNGTSTTAQINLYNNSDTTNVSVLQNIVGTGEISFRSSINGTGTYLPMTFYTSGSERMRIDTSGNVGIGTSSPRFKLSIGAITTTATNTPDTIDLGGTYSNGAGLVPKLRLYWDGTSSYGFGVSASQLDYIVPSGSAHVWYGAGSERMRITSAGDVGIGTTSPGTKLQVAGTSGTAQFRAGTASNGYLEINAYDSSAVYCVVAGANATSGVFGTQSNIPTVFFTNNTERMRIDTSGNVLIGTTTSPAGSKELVLAGDYIEGVVAIGTVTTSNTLSLANGTVQTATLTASTACTFTMPTAIAGKSFMLLLKQAATTGNGTATFTSVKWNGVGAPTITATAGKMDILSFISDGTNWYGSITQGFTP